MEKASKIPVLLMVVFMPFCGFSQNTGIQFVKGLSWRQVLDKAKQENKYIFLDCYASWCGPCKEMDNKVYSQPEVGAYMKAHFICVKMQMDSTGHDPEEISSRYGDARLIQKAYRIGTFPSFLYFSTDGTLVSRTIGYRDPDVFLSLSQNMLDPAKQYYTVLKAYGRHQMADSTIFFLVGKSMDLGDTSTAHRVATAYIDQNLPQWEGPNAISKPIIDFIINCTTNGFLSEKEAVDVFTIFRRDSVKFISVTGERPDRFLRFLIAKVEIDPYIMTASRSGKPDLPWDQLKGHINQKYDKQLADRPIIEAQVRWYGFKQNWPLYTRYTVELLQYYGTGMSSTDLNNYTWQVSLYSAKREELQAAIPWSKKALEQDPKNAEDLDTYAGLLYKTGRTKEALEIETKALQLLPGNKDLKDNYAKMLAGKPTWILPKDKSTKTL